MRYLPVERYEEFVRVASGEVSSLSSDDFGSHRWCRRRDLLGVVLGLHGMRVGEVVRLRRDDLLSDSLFVGTLKGGFRREIFFHSTAFDLLRDFLASHESDVLLPTARNKALHENHLRRFSRGWTSDVVGSPFRFHALRHTYAMWLYARTRDVLLVRKALGHRRLESTLIYAESLSRIRDLLFDVASTDNQHD